jgi:hypothetical protein
MPYHLCNMSTYTNFSLSTCVYIYLAQKNINFLNFEQDLRVPPIPNPLLPVDNYSNHLFGV